MSIRTFYITLLAIFATVFALSIAWEFWLEDLLLPMLVSHHEIEPLEERWEFVGTVTVFSFLALIGPTLIGAHLIRRGQAHVQAMVRMSEEDYLTGLYNRRRTTEILRSELQRATRYDTALSVILLDIDHFKAINDEYGHQAGDEALTMIADVIRSCVRATDMVGRWGGEEFVIISPGTDLSGGFSLAEKIRSRLESEKLGNIDHRTASFGVTAFAQGDNVEDIIARVDAGLYKAKQAGRNRVEKVPATVGGQPVIRPFHQSGVGAAQSS